MTLAWCLCLTIKEGRLMAVKTVVPMAAFSYNSNTAVLEEYRLVMEKISNLGFLTDDFPKGLVAHMAYMLANPWNEEDAIFEILRNQWLRGRGAVEQLTKDVFWQQLQKKGVVD